MPESWNPESYLPRPPEKSIKIGIGPTEESSRSSTLPSMKKSSQESERAEAPQHSIKISLEPNKLTNHMTFVQSLENSSHETPIFMLLDNTV